MTRGPDPVLEHVRLGPHSKVKNKKTLVNDSELMKEF